MSAIKKFFEKKKADVKFKLAGQGQKLGDAAQQQRAAAAEAAAASHSRSQQQQHRGPLTDQQAAVAAANLARVAKTRRNEENEGDFEKKRSLAAIRAQARKELEREKAELAEAEKLKEVYGEKEEIEIEVSPSIPGVFYTCPIVGPEVLPKEEMKRRIKQFLYDQLDEEQGLTSCLIIHTCNSDKEKVQACVDTLCKYLNNILEHPTEEKYRKIRKSNKVYQDRVASLEGVDLFLSAAGFDTKMIDDQEFWVFPEDRDLETIQMLKEALVTAEPIRAELDRGLKVLLPKQAKERFALPSDFFALTPQEIKKEQKSREEMVERQGMLRTKAMREKEELRERRKYRFSLIRVKFPDGLVLQGTFSIYETFGDILDFVRNALEVPLDFVLHDAVGGGILDMEKDAKIVDVGGLVPTAVLIFAWNDEDMINQRNTPYLKPELKMLAQD